MSFANLQPHPNAARRPRGVTAVELLVVLAIVGVLIGLSSMAFGRLQAAREASEVETWRNLRKIGKTNLRSRPLRVLFVGNSYTEFNDLPRMIQTFAAESRQKPEIETIGRRVVGFASFFSHWIEDPALHDLYGKEWDFLVLQDFSLSPIETRGAMFEYGRKFSQSAKSRSAIPLFYLTWSREWAPQNQEILNNSYITLAREVGGEVAPAGMAWDLCRKANPEIKIFSPDGSHPSPKGTYLTACAFFAAIYMKSPEGVVPSTVCYDDRTVVDLSPSEAAILQRHAWRAYQDLRKRLYDDVGLDP